MASKDELKPKEVDKVDQLIEELLKKNLGPQSGSYAGTGKKTVQQGREESRRGKTPPMGISKKDTSVIGKNIDRERIRKLINKFRGPSLGKFLKEEILTTNPKTKVRDIKKRLRHKGGTGLERPIAMSKKGGSVSRKKGSKIMQGYKAGGKV